MLTQHAGPERIKLGCVSFSAIPSFSYILIPPRPEAKFCSTNLNIQFCRYVSNRLESSDLAEGGMKQQLSGDLAGDSP